MVDSPVVPVGNRPRIGSGMHSAGHTDARLGYYGCDQQRSWRVSRGYSRFYQREGDPGILDRSRDGAEEHLSMAANLVRDRNGGAL